MAAMPSYTATCMVYTATTSVAPMLLSTVLFRVITPRSNCAGHSSLDPPQRRCRPQLPLLVLTFPVLSAAVAVTVSEQQHFTAIWIVVPRLLHCRLSKFLRRGADGGALGCALGFFAVGLAVDAAAILAAPCA